jgi:hypothetical protein
MLWAVEGCTRRSHAAQHCVPRVERLMHRPRMHEARNSAGLVQHDGPRSIVDRRSCGTPHQTTCNVTSNEVWFADRYSWIVLGTRAYSMYDQGMWKNLVDFFWSGNLTVEDC